MLLKRKKITQENWKIIIIPFLFLSSAIAFALLSDYLIGGKPIYEPWFGSFFVWPHVFALAGIILFLFFMMKNKPGFFAHPSQVFMNEEQRLFEHYYFRDNEDKKDQSKFTKSLILHFLISFLPLFVLLWLGKYVLNMQNLAPAAIAGIFLMMALFFRGVSRAMEYHAEIGKNFLKKVNNHLKDTHLSFKNQFGGFLMGIKVSLNVGGTFKGRKVDVQTSTAALKIGQGTKLNQTIKVILPLQSDLEFSLEEKNPKWYHLKSNNLNSYFQERFNLKGCHLKDLPDSFKKRISNYSRNLYLQVKPGELIYHSKDPFITPFYTLKGMILFLEELSQMAAELSE